MKAPSSSSPRKPAVIRRPGLGQYSDTRGTVARGAVRPRASAPRMRLNRGGRDPRQTHPGWRSARPGASLPGAPGMWRHHVGHQSHSWQLLRWRVRFRQYLEISPVMYHRGTHDLQSQPTSLPLQRDQCYYRGWPLRSASWGEQASLIRKEVSWMLPVSAPAGH